MAGFIAALVYVPRFAHQTTTREFLSLAPQTTVKKAQENIKNYQTSLWGIDKKTTVCEDSSMTGRKTKVTFTTDELMPVAQAARELQVHIATVYRWIKKEILHPCRIGNQVYLNVNEVRALKDQRGGEEVNR
ncbi:hypothetical protein ES703_86312 [subsurface metagenome]